jgi:uncharacterized protein (DUF58 family)
MAMPESTNKHSPVSSVRAKPSLDFSVTGLIYCSMMMFMGLAAINSQANLLFGVFGLMIGILLVTMVINWLVPRRLAITRHLPENGAVGEPLVISYQIRNDKHYWPSLSLTIAELDAADAFTKQPHAYLLHVASRSTATISAELIPRRRGLHRLNRYQISTSFPFGFIKRAAERAMEDQLLIYPPIGHLSSKLLTLFQSAERSGSSMRPRRGGMDEFYGLKEYREGENPRYIYWRRSARVGTLVSKEMTHVSPPRLLLLVDTFLGQQGDENRRADVERVIAMAATIIDKSMAMGLSLGMIAWSGRWLHAPMNRGKRHRRDLLHILARLPANREFDQTALLDEAFDHHSSGTTQVLISPTDHPMGLGEHARGSTMVISPAIEHMMHWFTFDPAVDFAHCTPTDQEG